MQMKVISGAVTQTYEGFGNKVDCMTPIIAVAVFYGEPELMAVDAASDKVADEIDRYYREAYGRGPESLRFYQQVVRK